MTRIFFTALLGLAMSGVATSDVPTSSICVAPVPAWLAENEPADPEVRCPQPAGPYAYAYHIDNRPRVTWSSQKSERISDLELNERHRIRVWCNGLAQQTVDFRFASYKSPSLCFFLNDLYGTAQLWERAPWCKCK